jgi:uncharacterized protein YcnI
VQDIVAAAVQNAGGDADAVAAAVAAATVSEGPGSDNDGDEDDGTDVNTDVGTNVSPGDVAVDDSAYDMDVTVGAYDMAYIDDSGDTESTEAESTEAESTELESTELESYYGGASALVLEPLALGYDPAATDDAAATDDDPAAADDAADAVVDAVDAGSYTLTEEESPVEADAEQDSQPCKVNHGCDTASSRCVVLTLASGGKEAACDCLEGFVVNVNNAESCLAVDGEADVDDSVAVADVAAAAASAATEIPSAEPTDPPTDAPIEEPSTEEPTGTPTEEPTDTPTEEPMLEVAATEAPALLPTAAPTESTAHAAVAAQENSENSENEVESIEVCKVNHGCDVASSMCVVQTLAGGGKQAACNCLEGFVVNVNDANSCLAVNGLVHPAVSLGGYVTPLTDQEMELADPRYKPPAAPSSGGGAPMGRPGCSSCPAVVKVAGKEEEGQAAALFEVTASPTTAPTVPTPAPTVNVALLAFVKQHEVDTAPEPTFQPTELGPSSYSSFDVISYYDSTEAPTEGPTELPADSFEAPPTTAPVNPLAPASWSWGQVLAAQAEGKLGGGSSVSQAQQEDRSYRREAAVKPAQMASMTSKVALVSAATAVVLVAGLVALYIAGRRRKLALQQAGASGQDSQDLFASASASLV